MIMPEAEARTKICALNLYPGRTRFMRCVGCDCMTYWRWSNPEHTEGYCAAAGKPEN